MLKRGEVDLTIMIDSIINFLFIFQKIMDAFIVVIVNKKSPLANENSLDILKLKNEKFIILNKNNKINELFLSLYDKYSFKPNLVYEGVMASEVCGIVQSNPDMIGILPSYYTFTFDNENLRFIPLMVDNEKVKANIYIASNKDNFLLSNHLEFRTYLAKEIRKSNKQVKSLINL